MGSHQEMIIYEKVVLIKCPCSFQSLSYIAVKDFFQMQMCSVAFLPFLILFTALKIKIKIFYLFYKVLHVLVSIYFFRILANQPPLPSWLVTHIDLILGILCSILKIAWSCFSLIICQIACYLLINFIWDIPSLGKFC